MPSTIEASVSTSKLGGLDTTGTPNLNQCLRLKLKHKERQPKRFGRSSHQEVSQKQICLGQRLNCTNDDANKHQEVAWHPSQLRHWFGQEILTKKAIIMCNPRTQKKKNSPQLLYFQTIWEKPCNKQFPRKHRRLVINSIIKRPLNSYLSIILSMRTSGSKNIAQTLNSRSQEEGFI